MKRHEEEDCDVCQKEESKSKTLKLNKTKIIQKEIIPFKKCWDCHLDFEDEDAQIQHLRNEHECQLCDDYTYFTDPAYKKKHHSIEHVCEICGKCLESKTKKRRHKIKTNHYHSSEFEFDYGPGSCSSDSDISQ